jgi:hypothetical protein
MTEPLCLVFIPPLIALLHDAEAQKGMPLDEAEVLAIRDQAAAITLPFDVALQMEQQRGYRDLVAEDCWNEWLALK